MSGVQPVPWARPTLLLLAVGAVWWGPSAEAAGHRLMVGETIRVGPGDSLDAVTCIACSIRVEGTVQDRALLVFGTLENRGTIEGDAIVIAGTLSNEGPIRGDAIVVAGTMELRGNVGRNASAILADIEIGGPEVRIDGDAVTVLGELRGHLPRTVGGSIEHVGGQRVGRLLLSGMLGAALLLLLFSGGTLLAINLLGYFILGSQRLSILAATIANHQATCFLLGLGTCFALLVVGLVVAMLLPGSLPILFMLGVVSAVGYCGVTYGVGRNLYPGLPPVWSTGAASLLVLIVQAIPVVGQLVLLVVWNVAIGAAVLSGFGTAPDWLRIRLSGIRSG